MIGDIESSMMSCVVVPFMEKVMRITRQKKYAAQDSMMIVGAVTAREGIPAPVI
jgi:hypothetical protein